MVVNYFIQFQQ